MITRLTNFVLRGYQGYAIDKSQIKKVFSVRRNDKKGGDKKSRMVSMSEFKKSKVNALDENQNRLKESIQDRAIFSYGYDRNCAQKWLGMIRWFFCECWCQPCCPRKPR